MIRPLDFKLKCHRVADQDYIATSTLCENKAPLKHHTNQSVDTVNILYSTTGIFLHYHMHPCRLLFHRVCQYSNIQHSMQTETKTQAWNFSAEIDSASFRPGKQTDE